MANSCRDNRESLTTSNALPWLSHVASDPSGCGAEDVCVSPLIRMRVKTGSGNAVSRQTDPEVGGVVPVDFAHANGDPGCGGKGSGEVDVDGVSPRLVPVWRDDVGLRVRCEANDTRLTCTDHESIKKLIPKQTTLSLNNNQASKQTKQIYIYIKLQ